jgi:DMSO/TMAO reductase YedYZ molybdopterin-dependent catalytic subunit
MRDGRRGGSDGPDDSDGPGGLSRRGFLTGVGAAVGSVVVLTGGQSFAWLRGVNLFGARTKNDGPQSLSITKTASAAQVEEPATDPAWRLTVAHGGTTRTLSRADLLAMPQTEVDLPIACVEGWSTMAHWKGVRPSELLALVGAPEGSAARFTSLEPSGPYRVMTMEPEFVRNPDTMVALELNGEPLAIDHGYPARVIAPARPGVLQTKWLSRVETT